VQLLKQRFIPCVCLDEVLRLSAGYEMRQDVLPIFWSCSTWHVNKLIVMQGSSHQLQNMTRISNGVYWHIQDILDTQRWVQITEYIFYCKRAILFLSSSKILTPSPSPPGECVPPRLCCGGRTDSPGGEGDGGVNILEDERNRIALLG